MEHHELRMRPGAGQIDPLELHSRLGVHGERWDLGGAVPPSGESLIPSRRLLEPAALESTIRQAAEHLGTSNLRPAASLWQKHYCAALLMPVLAAMTIAGAGLDGSAGNVSIRLDSKGLPRRIFLHDPAPAIQFTPRWDGGSAGDGCCGLGELQSLVLESVREGHLAPLIDQLRAVTGIPRRLLWTNAANVVADLYDTLARRPESSHAAGEDRLALLDSPVDLLTGGANPLFGLVRYEPLVAGALAEGLPALTRVRNACCQRYLLPGYKSCTTCPRLSPEQRTAALLEAKKK